MSSTFVEVNGELITAEQIRQAAARDRAEAEAAGIELTPEERLNLRDQAIESLIDRTLLLQEARRLKICSNPDEDLLIRNLVEHWMQEVPVPKISELRDFYRKNRDRFSTAERAWAAHIVKHTEGVESEEKHTEVEHLRRRVLKGESFAAVAAHSSDCPENGGDLGYFPRGTMVEEFENIIFSVPLNTLTPVFKTCFGYHIAIVYDRKPAGIAAFDEIRPELERLVHRTKQDRELGRRLALLRDKAVIRR